MSLTLLVALVPMGAAFTAEDVVEDPSTTAAADTADATATEAPGHEPVDDANDSDDSGSADDARSETAPGGGAGGDGEPVEKVEQSEDGVASEGFALQPASAHNSGPYDSTTDGSPSGNGNGDNDNGNKPCAGCVGNADDKNPPGQLPGPEDDGDKGYECDGNSGVGKTNPAHSGCKADGEPIDPNIKLEKDGPARAQVSETITYTFK